ncbi:MAG: helix-turn-helix transcriptional regulator [Spirochaetales bacterium]|nr:helix-turn-helix transcriptional regulator [Spirochaetales bacterium]
MNEKRQHGTPFFHFSIYDNDKTFPDMHPHWHDEFEILYGIKGNVEVHIGEDVFVIEKGEVIIIPCKYIHSSNSFNRSFFFHAIVFDPDILSGSLRETYEMNYIEMIKEHRVNYNLHMKGLVDWERDIILHVGNIIRYYYEKPTGYELGIKGALCSIFFELIANNPVMNKYDSKKKLELQRLKNTIVYIQNNYSNKISVAKMADKCNMSAYYFCRFFKKVIGMSPFDYLNNYRIQEAARLLKETDSSITLIAYNVGFNDSSYFSKIFHKYKKCTPSEFRNS